MPQCAYCFNEILDSRLVCPVCGTRNTIDTPTELQPPAPTDEPVNMPSPPLDSGRFVAGTLLGQRYRLIGLVGRGGMGEVYKAEDLKLRQLVSLKFLPEAVSTDASMLARFHREVRTARHITHQNVCRVHDICEVALGSRNLHFISMEYIDGEDLSTLLRRIGHFPVHKAMELARQICSGLSAAHEMGVLHRDLKPANIMLDGRGRARIADFGLASLAEDFANEDRSGTPAYMAPEQLQGAPASARSDIYALGLVLYEIFTGSRAFEGGNIAELIHRQQNSTPSPPSTRAREIDPLAERAILQCLSIDPSQRPGSPLEVLAALPGGDPLAAALAAGETPSPAMVAAAGEKVGLRPAHAWACLIGVVLVSLAVAFPFNPAQVRPHMMDQSPDALAQTAKDIIGRSGYSTTPADTAHGFMLDEELLTYGRVGNDAAAFRSFLDRERPGWIRFWYRGSSGVLTPGSLHTIGPVFARPGMRITREDPPPLGSRMVSAVLDPQARLMEFTAVPSPDDAPSDAVPDWNVLFSAAHLVEASLEPTEPKDMPKVAFDNRVAWKGRWHGNTDIPIQVEAASWRGKPVSFKVLGPWSAGVQEPRRILLQQRALTAIIISVVIFSLLGGAFFAWHNVRIGRGDRRGAFRLALFALSALLLSWLFGSDHALDPNEFNLFLSAIGECLYWSSIVGVMYLAVEPFVRQRWPHALISWNRVLEGRLKDPLVGRDVLIGAVFAAGLSLARTATLLTHFMSPELPEADLMAAIVRDSYSISFLLNLIFDSANIPLALFFLLAIFRIVTRSQWIAAGGLIVLINAFVNLGARTPNPEVSGILIGTLFSVLWLVAVTRFGLICGMSLWFADRVFRAITMLAPDAWYAGRMYLLLAAVLALTVYSFKTSLGNQPLVSEKILGHQS